MCVCVAGVCGETGHLCVVTNSLRSEDNPRYLPLLCTLFGTALLLYVSGWLDSGFQRVSCLGLQSPLRSAVIRDVLFLSLAFTWVLRTQTHSSYIYGEYLNHWSMSTTQQVCMLFKFENTKLSGSYWSPVDSTSVPSSSDTPGLISRFIFKTVSC